MSKQIYKLTIEPITCVHIGTGKQLTMLDYMVITTKAGQERFLKYSSDKLLQRIATDKKLAADFEKVSFSNDMKALMLFFHNTCKPMEDLDYLCETTKDFCSEYGKNKNKDPYENAAFVEQMYRPEGSMNPVIPGSSFKGALRTAILNQKMHEISDEDYDSLYDELENNRDMRKFEKSIQIQLLGNYKNEKNDPFRAIEISDSNFEARDTQIVGRAANFDSNKQNGELLQKSIQIQVEAIKGYFIGNQNKSVSQLRINTDLYDKKGCSMSITEQDIINSCNYFYLREFNKEYEKFYQEASTGCDLIAKLKGELKTITETKNQFIIRVGRWSQVEFMTFEENFRRLPSGEGTGSTRTLFNYDGQYLPFGWCKCTLEQI